MTLTLPKWRLETGPLTISEIQHLFEQLPAEQRAAIKWAPNSVRTSINRLYLEPLSQDLIISVSVEVFTSLHDVCSRLLPLFSQLKSFRSEIKSRWEEKCGTIRTYLQDPAAIDQAEWAFRALISFFHLFFSMPTDELHRQFSDIEPSAIQTSISDRRIGAILRAEILVIAIIEGFEQNLDYKRAEDLAEWAFLEADKAVRFLAKGGVRINPFDTETQSQRSKRILRYAQHARSALSEDDLAIIEASRMANLK